MYIASYVCIHIATLYVSISYLFIISLSEGKGNTKGSKPVQGASIYVHMYIDTHIQLLINQLDVKLNFHVSAVTLH